MKITETNLRLIIKSVLKEARSEESSSNSNLVSVSEEEYTPQVLQCLDLIEKFESSGYNIQDFNIGKSRDREEFEIHFKVDCSHSMVNVYLWSSIDQSYTPPFRASIRSVTKQTIVEVPVGPVPGRTQKMELGRYYLGREWYGQYYTYDTTNQGSWVGALKRICALSEIPPQERPFKDAKTKRSREGKVLRAVYGNVTDRQFKNRPEFNGYY